MIRALQILTLSLIVFLTNADSRLAWIESEALAVTSHRLLLSKSSKSNVSSARNTNKRRNSKRRHKLRQSGSNRSVSGKSKTNKSGSHRDGIFTPRGSTSSPTPEDAFFAPTLEPTTEEMACDTRTRKCRRERRPIYTLDLKD